jgi:hypothetical protein
MLLDAPTFVVHRRLNQPLSVVQRGLADRTMLTSTPLIDLGSDGFLHLDGALRPAASFSSRQPMPTWCGRAHLLNARRRPIATVEIEISMWSTDATSISLRPVARHPERWRSWRLRAYFALAHRASDTTAALLAHRAALVRDAVDAEVAPDERVATPVSSSC